MRAARDRAALLPLPAYPYLVTDRYLRRVGKDCLFSFEASLYSVPATLVSAGMRVDLRVSPETVAVHATGPSPVLLATHRRARHRGDDQIEPAHWKGLPDGRLCPARHDDRHQHPGPRPGPAQRRCRRRGQRRSAVGAARPPGQARCRGRPPRPRGL